MLDLQVSCIDPILSVSDMQRSLRFYVDLLGFKNAEWGDDDFTCVSRDGCNILLSKGHQGHPGTWIYIAIDSARDAFASLSARGATIQMELTKQAWALEFNVEDPDGHVLRFGSEPDD